MDLCKKCRNYYWTVACSCRRYEVKCEEWGVDEFVEQHASDPGTAAEKFVEENDDDGAAAEEGVVKVVVRISDRMEKTYIVTAEYTIDYTATEDTPDA